MSILQLYHPFHHTLYCYYIVPVHFMLMVYFKAITFYKTIKLSSHHILLLTDTHIHMHTHTNQLKYEHLKFPPKSLMKISILIINLVCDCNLEVVYMCA